MLFLGRDAAFYALFGRHYVAALIIGAITAAMWIVAERRLAGRAKAVDALLRLHARYIAEEVAATIEPAPVASEAPV